MKISEADVKKRLDVYVSEVNAITRSHAQTMIDSGLVRVNGKSEGKNYKLRLNDEIEIDEANVTSQASRHLGTAQTVSGNIWE